MLGSPSDNVSSNEEMSGGDSPTREDDHDWLGSTSGEISQDDSDWDSKQESHITNIVSVNKEQS